MTKEEIESFVSELRKENPEIARDLLNAVDTAVDVIKNEMMSKKVIDVILDAGHSLSDKYTLLNRARIRAFSKKLEHAKLLNLSEIDEIERAITETNKILQNPDLEILHSICQEMFGDFFEKLEMYLDILGESPEGGELNPLQPYTLQLTSVEKKQVVDSVEMMEGLAYRGEQLSNKLKTFITSNAERVISYHHELLYFQSLLEMKKTVKRKLDESQSEDVMEGDGKFLKIPIKIKRDKKGKETDLEQDHYAILTHYFQKARVFLSDDSHISDTSASKAMQILSGYHYENIRKKLGSLDFSNDQKTVVKEKLKEVILLIDKDLPKKKAPQKS